MKYIVLILFVILSSCANNVKSSERVDMQNYVDEALSKSLVSEFPIFVLSDISVKNLSVEWMKTKYYKGLRRSNLFLIPKNCDSAQLIWGKGAEKGVIVEKSAAYSKPQTDKTRYIYNGKEITSMQRDTLNFNTIKDIIYIKVDRISYGFCFMSSFE